MIFFRLMYTSNAAIKLLEPFFTSQMMVLAPLNFYNSNMSASFVNHILIWYLFRSPNNICFAYLWYLSQHTVVSLFVYVFLGGKRIISLSAWHTYQKWENYEKECCSDHNIGLLYFWHFVADSPFLRRYSC